MERHFGKPNSVRVDRLPATETGTTVTRRLGHFCDADNWYAIRKGLGAAHDASFRYGPILSIPHYYERRLIILNCLGPIEVELCKCDFLLWIFLKLLGVLDNDLGVIWSLRAGW